MKRNMVKVAPSLLAANFGNLAWEIAKVENGGASWLHYDVMDGHFVPNISFGYSILGDVKKVTSLPLDVHLMVEDPGDFVEKFIENGADYITFHVESMASERQIARLIDYLHIKGVKAGLSIKPDTPVSAIEPYLNKLDLVLVMSVEPGFGGQKFNPVAVEKIARLAELKKEKNYNYVIEVDGGINNETIDQVKDAGVEMVVAGSYVFGSPNYQQAIESLK